MREKKSGYRRATAWLLALMMLVSSLLNGCGNRYVEDENHPAYLPLEISLVAEASAVNGSPVALTRQDSGPVVDFSDQLMKKALESARADGKENVVLSPVSVYLALMVMACVSEEASWDTYAQMFGVPQEQWNDYGSRLIRHMNWAKEDSCVAAANSLWMDDSVSLPSADLMRISQNLYTNVYQGNLQHRDIVKSINIWVDNQTRGMIQEFRQDPYDEFTTLSILNAVYLEAKWQDAFSASATMEKVFYTASNEEIVTAFMTDSLCQRGYIREEGMDGVVLPYRDGNLAFVALRPTAGQTVDDLLVSLHADDWKDVCDKATDTFLNFSMPKFTLEYQQTLTDVVTDLGVVPELGIGQKVKIQVDEDGTKAAAVTEVTAGGIMEVPEGEPLEIHLDHPFVYGIVDTVSGVPLFVGVLDRPVQ